MSSAMPTETAKRAYSRTNAAWKQESTEGELVRSYVCSHFMVCRAHNLGVKSDSDELLSWSCMLQHVTCRVSLILD